MGRNRWRRGRCGRRLAEDAAPLFHGAGGEVAAPGLAEGGRDFSQGRLSPVLTGHDSAHLHQAEQEDGGGRELGRTGAEKAAREVDQAPFLRNPVSETGDHPLFEVRIRRFLRESLFKNSVHGLYLLLGLTAGGAFRQVLLQTGRFLRGQLAVRIGREPLVNVFVNAVVHLSSARAGRSSSRKVRRARPRMPRNAPLLRSSARSIAA